MAKGKGTKTVKRTVAAAPGINVPAGLRKKLGVMAGKLGYTGDNAWRTFALKGLTNLARI